jgi:hypothetical protein
MNLVDMSKKDIFFKVITILIEARDKLEANK